MKRYMRKVRTALPVLAFFLAVVIAADATGRVVPADAGAEVEKKPPMIALTFDDGPMRGTTTALLDGLAQRGVQATFFLIGEQVIGNEDIVERMAREGHQIGIHTYDHVTLTGLNRSDFDAQVDKTRRILENVLGYDDFMLRPPYGLYDEGVQAMAGCPIVLWSIDPEDWGDKNARREIEHIVSRAQDGAVILLHDIYSQSVEAALAVVDELHRQGYLFVTVEELFDQRGIELEAGKVYRSAS